MQPAVFRRVLCWIMLALGVAACDRQTPPGAEADHFQHYTVRGEMMALPEANAAAARVRIRHEAIPTFINDKGEVVGMETMTMPFDLAPGVSVEGLAVGDPVEFEYVVDWPNFESWIASIRKLPEGTTLDFTRPRPPDAGG